MPSSVVATYKDWQGQKSNFRVRTRDMDAANHDALKTEMNALLTAIDGICKGNLQRKVFNAEDTLVSDGTASEPTANREMKWLVTYEDTVTHEMQVTEIPCPDITNAALFKDDREHLDLGDEGPVEAFVTAFEAVVQSKEGNTVTVRKIKKVGRNL